MVKYRQHAYIDLIESQQQKKQNPADSPTPLPLLLVR